jgi:outer membrane lipoprotein-sorting protein
VKHNYDSSDSIPVWELVFSALLAAIVLAVILLAGCVSSAASRAAAYQAELLVCSEMSATLSASVRCENDVRVKFGRPKRMLFLRTDANGVPIVDGGAE